MRTLHRPFAFAALGSWLAVAVITSAQTQDAPPPDLNSLLQELKKIREQQTAQLKQQRQQALQQVTAAAASAERAVAIWEDAVRAVQFDGATKEGAAFKEWKEREGDGLNSKEGRNAARLFFAWLALTMQHSAGTPVKDLMPQVVSYTKELNADREMMEALEEGIKKDKELAATGKHGAKRPGGNDDEKVKRMHDQVLNKGLAASPVVRWMKLEEFISSPAGPGAGADRGDARAGGRAKGAAGWEDNPGNYDGIFNSIILPELRAQRDPRLIEYWDMRLKKEAEIATKQKLTFNLDKYNNERRPSLLWSRAEDLMLLGQKNRAVTEMFNLIKTFPHHPDADTWIASLEGILIPPLPAAAAPVPAATGAAPEAPPVVK